MVVEQTREKSKQELSLGEARFQSLYNSDEIGILIADYEGVVFEANDTFLSLIGYSRADMAAGKVRWDHMTPEEFRLLSQEVFGELRTKGAARSLEKQYIHQDGHRVDVWVGGLSLVPGSPDHVVACVLDISKRKKTEKDLIEREELYRLVVEGMNDGVWDWGIQSGEDFVSERYLDILGLPRGTVLTKEMFASILHPDDMDELRNKIEAHLKLDEPFEMEYRLRHASGQYLTCLARGKALRNEQGEPVHMAGVLTDITRQKKAFERERLTRRVAELANQGLELHEILDIIAQEIGKFFQADRTFVSHLERSGEKYHINLLAQYCRTAEIKQMDWRGMSPKLLDVFMRNQSPENLIKAHRLRGREQLIERMKQRLEMADFSPEEKEIFYQELVSFNELQGTRSIMAVPVIYRGIPYGSLNVQQCTYDRAWQDDEFVTLQEIATQVGTVFYQAELYRQEQQAKNALQKSFEKEHLLRKIVEVIGQSFDIDLILNTIAQAVGQYLDADRCGVSRFYFDDDELVFCASGQYCKPGVRPADPDDIELITKALRHLTPKDIPLDQEQVTNISDPEKYIEHIRKEMDRFDLPGLSTEKIIELVKKYEAKSTLKVNIRYRGVPYGSINLSQISHNREWLPDEVELVKIIAEHAGSAIYQAELYRQEHRAKEEAEKRFQRESLMRRLVEMINQSQDVKAIMDTAAREVGQFLGADRTLLTRYNFDKRQQKLDLLVSTQYCANETVQPLSDKDIALIIEAVRHVSPELLEATSDQITIMNNLEEVKERYRERLEQMQVKGMDAGELLQFNQKYGNKSALRAGIFYRGIPYGGISLHQCSHYREWQQDEVDLLNSVADQLGIALAQAELYQAEQQARKEAEEANRKKSEFLALISHELRTPLNSIIGYSRMIENGMAGPINEQQGKYIHNVSVNGHHLLTIINDLLDVSKIEAGKLQIVTEPIEVKPILDELERLTQTLAQDKQIQLAFHIQPDLGIIQVDPTRLRQIFLNLISNAIKFNRPGGHVTVRAYTSEDHLWMMGDVQDTGIGIPQDKLPKLFDKFYQVDASAARAQEGTGLGLLLIKSLVELHGGDITVKSTEGIGSTFSFKIPIIRSAIHLKETEYV